MNEAERQKIQAQIEILQWSKWEHNQRWEEFCRILGSDHKRAKKVLKEMNEIIDEQTELGKQLDGNNN